MAKVLFKRYETDAEAQASNIVDGQFIVTKEGTSYTDYGTDRVAFGGTLDTQMSDNSINGVQNKVIKEYVDNEVSDGVQEVKGYVDGKNTYSTTETVVGTYNDKPLYRKIISGKLPTGNGTNNFTITNGVIRKYDGLVKSSYGSWFPLNIYYTSDTTYNISSFCNASRNNLYVVCGSQYNTNSDYEITIEYTKTTDV